MRIEDIKDPGFLKKMNDEECEQLCSQIRTFLINSVSKTGGHIASNLGVVELTVALHRVFESPDDKIFFDVGHQCYTHKILTGRADKFDTLRQYGGISGFQKRKESIHDVWEAGHSSTSLSAALGMAIARDLNHEKHFIVPVIGDGALESGMSLEALNEIGDEQRRIIIIFNDNNMSISKNVGSLSRGFARLRINSGYTGLKSGMEHELEKTGLGSKVLAGLRSVKNAFKDTVVDRGIFEEFDIDYLGPIDGHNIKELTEAFETAKGKAEHRPVVVHVITTKGKGYKPCENDRTGKWHGVGPFDPATGKELAVKRPGFASWSFVFSDTVRKMAEKNKDILAITPAMKVGSGLEGFFKQFPDRSFDTGIAEEHAVTLAASLALSGKRPYICVYSTFLQRAYDQLSHDVCRMDLPVVIGIDRAGLVGADGPTHHGVFDIGMLRAMPHMILAQGSDAREAADLLYTAFSQMHPFAIRYERGDVRYDADQNERKLIPVGSWSVHGDLDSDDPVICTYGTNVGRIISDLEDEQIPATVINCRFFKPLDDEVMKKLCEKGQKVFVYETDVKAEGLGSAMLEWASDHGYALLVKRYGIGDFFAGQGDVSLLERDCGMDPDTLAKDIRAYLDERK